MLNIEQHVFQGGFVAHGCLQLKSRLPWRDSRAAACFILAKSS
jgi:hypothetical protein